MKSPTFLLVTAAATLCISSASAAVILQENFDGGGANSVFTYSGSATTFNYGGVNNNAARLTPLTGSQNNSIAFDAVNIPAAPQLLLSFDFRMTDDAANTAAGGCCGEAADGFGIGFFPTAVYGSTGATNPAIVSNFAWERPAVAGAFTIGFDVFDGGPQNPNGNNPTLNFNGTQIAETNNPGFLLNNNLWHRALLTVTANGSDALASLRFVEDVNGAAVERAIFTDVAVAGLDINSGGGLGSNYRLVAGGRTGGAFVESAIDNVRVEAVPEPGSVLAAVMGGAVLLGLRRRRA